MSVKFMFDRLQKQQEETIGEILKLIEKKPYPDKVTLHLAKFVESLFEAGHKINEEEKERKLKKEEEAVVEEVKEEVTEEGIGEKIDLIKQLLPQITPTPPLSQLTPIPEVVEKPPEEKVIEEKPKFEPHYTIEVFETPVDITIVEDSATKAVKYYVTGPQISLKLITAIKEELKKDFEKDHKIISDEEHLAKIAKKLCKKLNMEFTEDMVKKIKFFLYRDLLGFMKLDPLLRDTNVKSVYCEGVDKPVMVEHVSLPGKIETNVIFTDNNDINDIIGRIAKKTDNEVSKDRPILNTTYMGVEIQAVMGVGGVSSKLTLKKLV